MWGLVKRGDNFSAVVSVPKDVQWLIGKKQLWKSTRTTDSKLACESACNIDPLLSVIGVQN